MLVPKRHLKYVVKSSREYIAKNDDQLTFKKNELIGILNDDDPDWFVGRIGGTEGLVPAEYCIRSDAKYPAMALNDSRTNAPGYLTFKKGDIISILNNTTGFFHIGWFKGMTGQVANFSVRRSDAPIFICTLSYSSPCRGDSVKCHTCNHYLCEHHYETHVDVATCDYHNCNNIAKYGGRCGYHANRCLAENYDGR